MAIVPLITFILFLGLLTGANFFALGASTFLVVMQLGRYFSEKWIEAIHVERELPNDSVEIGQSLAIGLKLQNRSGFMIPWLLVEDRIAKRDTQSPPVAVKLQMEPTRLQWFAARRNYLKAYSIALLRRGYFQIGPTLVETGDLLGLHRSFRIACEAQHITVLPKLVPLEGLEYTSRRPMGELRVDDRVLEDPTLMVGLREYQPGDPMNRVHWKATARTGVLHTRVFQPTCVQGALLLVDMHEESNPKNHEPVRSDLAVTAAASIAYWLYSNGEPFGLITNGRDAADRVRAIQEKKRFENRADATQGTEMKSHSDRLRPIVLGANRTAEHFDEMHHLLARLDRTDGLRLHELLQETESRIPKMLSLIVVAQQIDQPGAMALEMLSKRGFSISILLNCHQEDFVDRCGPLVAAGLHVDNLCNEESLRQLNALSLLSR